MDLRSIVITLVIFVLLARALKKPYVGALAMVWIGYMNPHRLVPWGFIYSLPIAFWAFLATLTGLAFAKEKIQLPESKMKALLLIFWFWCAVCTVFAFDTQPALREFIRFTKILIGVFLCLALLQSKNRIVLLVWVIALSIGFYGIKGGVFSIATLGSFRVWGPPDSFIEGNNELALALLMTVPLLYFLMTYVDNKWIKKALLGAILLCLISIVTSYSRGALLGLIAMSGFFWLKSKHKLPIAFAGFILVVAALPMMPDHWFERMDTIQSYEQDASAMGRINSWTLAFNLANDRITSGGFNHWGPTTFALYAPNPDKIHDAHSIYFEVLGEQGWIGLMLFLGILFGIWRLCNHTIKLADSNKAIEWCSNLSRMLQVSLVAYMSGGAFLGLAYWDLPYHLLCLAILVNQYVRKQENSDLGKRID
ncbi:putative O-glycosylation ligase, exosortase A system-associated [Thalassotalea sp. M1531]|uniref:Putative O-glycosylation ligase, exosortase A system-associated n=1 Tax=Thalassotalea algicola TaxID=2716224 RepID=A0A7Y0LEH5_9GAMM|nr:putative O-glycosylation ligase, exosortase A system-associated [Thalassotalea algicola]NMP33060.1 putative O-glycosylation ligase, exosortase A system-associated [Thalassotalea algicola]